MKSRQHTWSPERQMWILRVRMIDGEIERSEWVLLECVCVCVHSCNPMHALSSPWRLIFKARLWTRLCVCVWFAAPAGGRGCKDVEKGKETTLFPPPFHLCASTVMPASVPSAVGTKTTVTTHSFPWWAVARGRIGDFSQGYLWHCWSLILRVGLLRRPVPLPRHSPAHIQQNPFIFLAAMPFFSFPEFMFSIYQMCQKYSFDSQE